jgi:hypothetical protein
VIMIVRVPMACIQGRSRPPHKHRIRNHLLQARRGLQYRNQVRTGGGRKFTSCWPIRQPFGHQSIVSDLITDGTSR